MAKVATTGGWIITRTVTIKTGVIKMLYARGAKIQWTSSRPATWYARTAVVTWTVLIKALFGRFFGKQKQKLGKDL